MDKRKNNPDSDVNGLNDLSLSQLDAKLAAVLQRCFCPDAEDLLNYQWGLLGEDQTLLIAAHLAECHACAQEAEQLAPPNFSTLPKPGNSIRHLVQTFVAHLLPRGMAPAPVRSGTASSDPDSTDVDSPSVYQVSELGWDIIIVDQWPESNVTCFLQGQVLGPDEAELAALKVSLMQSGQIVATSSLKKTGVFEFQSVPAGLYAMCFHSDKNNVSIPNIFLE